MPCRCLILVHVALLPALVAQTDPRADQLGRLLAAEDRREYDPALFERGMASADPVVRRQATLGAGRIQDRRAGPALLAILDLPDTTGHAAAMFALGLLADSTLTMPIITRLGDSRPLAVGAVAEAPSTLAKLGSGLSRTLFSRLLDGTSRAVPAERRMVMIPGLLVEGWRFGPNAPVRAALTHVRDSSAQVRWRAAYLLGRTRAAVGTRALLAAAADPNPWTRQYAVRGLTRAPADSARLSRDSILPVLTRALVDADAGVRVNALLSLATWNDSTLVPLVLPLLADPIPNVRLQAVTALGALRGAAALGRLAALAALPAEPLVTRREALLGVSRTDAAWVRSTAAGLAGSSDPRVREVALELAVLTRPRDTLVFDPSPETATFAALAKDPDPGVRAAAIRSLPLLSVEIDVEILRMVADLLDDPDPRIRSAAWAQHIRRGSASPGYVSDLVQGLNRELARGRDGVTAPILAALRRIHESGGPAAETVDSLFLRTTTPPADYLMRRGAANWPALAERWGPVFPAEVRYSEAEYRGMAERFLLGSGGAAPRVRIQVEGRGVVEIEMLGGEAPLTVTNFLGLVEDGFFDGGEWHRVIPNFVVQDGAGPRLGARPGPAPIRDEFNPVRYDVPVLGMALSGPDTGTSQWFINLSPQPHLDGGYTVFGRVLSGQVVLERILQGDRIRSIRRQ